MQAATMQATSPRSRVRQHRRQNSTPTAFEATRFPDLPNIQPRRPLVSHRRGGSLGQHLNQMQETQQQRGRAGQYQLQRESKGAGVARVAAAAAGLGDQTGQTNQRPQSLDLGNPATPLYTQQSPAFPTSSPSLASFPNSPASVSHTASYMPTGPPDNELVAAAGAGQENFAPLHINTNSGFAGFPPNSASSTPTFSTIEPESPARSAGWVSDHETLNTRRHSRKMSDTIQGLVEKFEGNGNNLQSTPMSRSSTNQSGYLPSPQASPQEQLMAHRHSMVSAQVQPMPQTQLMGTQRPGRFIDGYDESMEETIKPRSTRQTLEGIFPSQPQRDPRHEMANNPAVVQTQFAHGFNNGFTGGYTNGYTTASPIQSPAFPSLQSMEAECVKIEHDAHTPDMFGSRNNTFGAPPVRTPQSYFTTPAATPFSGAAYTGLDIVTLEKLHRREEALMYEERRRSATEALTHQWEVEQFAQHQSKSEPPEEEEDEEAQPVPRRTHRRTHSEASVLSQASIQDLDLEQARVDTNVSESSVQGYMRAPESGDDKWTCTYKDCNKKFGRKENIKSHVQTHLNDRPYHCSKCNKNFVRPHDLKRHAKIHTGVKPFVCLCECSFARQDALTRHRQRGMCKGAFANAQRKMAKRGRPKKVTPETEDRLAKANEQRAKNKKSQAKKEIPNGSTAGSPTLSSRNSVSDSSSSAANSPGDEGVLDQHILDTPMSDTFDAEAMYPAEGFVLPEDLQGPQSAVSRGTTPHSSASSHASSPVFNPLALPNNNRNSFVPALTQPPVSSIPPAAMQSGPASGALFEAPTGGFTFDGSDSNLAALNPLLSMAPGDFVTNGFDGLQDEATQLPLDRNTTPDELSSPPPPDLSASSTPLLAHSAPPTVTRGPGGRFYNPQIVGTDDAPYSGMLGFEDPMLFPVMEDSTYPSHGINEYDVGFGGSEFFESVNAVHDGVGLMPFDGISKSDPSQ